MAKSVKKEREIFNNCYVMDMGFNKLIQNTIPHTNRNNYLENLIEKTLKRAEIQEKESERGNKYMRTRFWLQKHNYHPKGQHIANINTLKYHEPDCRDIHKMNEENKIETNNTNGLYSPCSHCKPHLNNI